MLKESAEKILRKLQDKITIISDRLLYRLSLIEETRGKELKARAETTTTQTNMARISTYPLDTDIEGTDKWIGTSATSVNTTKNFSVDAVAAFLNTSGIMESQALRYTYQDKTDEIGNDVRLRNTISFPTSQGVNVPFSTVSSWILSTYAKPNDNDVHPFYTSPLIGSTVLVTNATDIKNWGIFLWTSSAVVDTEPLFYDIGLTYVSGAGDLINGEDYLISLLGYDAGNSDDKNFIFTQLVPSAIWEIQHDLNKFPSVSVVNNNNILMYGDTTYGDNNNLTITFSGGFSGKAYLN
jgi:hypothetical protein